jgi:hypothetical protein
LPCGERPKRIFDARNCENITPKNTYTFLSLNEAKKNVNKYIQDVGKKILMSKKILRYGELNPGLAGLMLCLRAVDASHYITDRWLRKYFIFIKLRF